MTNEKLAVQAKTGNHDAMMQLWEAVRRLCFKIAGRYIPLLDRVGYTAEDMEQECFPAFCAALAAFEPDSGNKFTSYLTYPIQNAMRAVLGIHRGGTLPPAPLSLDEPLGEDSDGDTRGDLAPDPAAGQAFTDAEEQLYTRQLHDALEQCIDTLDERPALAVRAWYFDDRPLAQIGALLGVNTSRARQIRDDGLRGLRSGANVQRLRQFREEIISTRAYHGTGLAAWKNGGSVQERTIERLESKGLLG